MIPADLEDILGSLHSPAMKCGHCDKIRALTEEFRDTVALWYTLRLAEHSVIAHQNHSVNRLRTQFALTMGHWREIFEIGGPAK